MAKYFAIVNENGVAVRHPFKKWVRQNMPNLPADFLSNATTRQFKKRLVKMGWEENIGANTVFVIQPDENSRFDYAADYIDELDTELEEEQDEYEETQEMTFGLEADLQQALRRNIQFLEPGLEIIDGGRERHTSAGFIDITARDSEGRLVVIELKAPTAKPEVIAQTLAYMQSVQIEEQCDARGIIIASDFVDRVKLAARQIPKIRLVKYSYQFNFKEVE